MCHHVSQLLRLRNNNKQKGERREYMTVHRVHAAELGLGHTELHRRQQAKRAEALLQYLHVCPACPFSLLKLFV